MDLLYLWCSTKIQLMLLHPFLRKDINRNVVFQTSAPLPNLVAVADELEL